MLNLKRPHVLLRR